MDFYISGIFYFAEIFVFFSFFLMKFFVMKKISISFLLLFILLTLNAQDVKYPMGVLSGNDETYAEMAEKAALTRNFTVKHKLKPAVSLRRFAPTPGLQKFHNTSTAWASAYCARTIIEAIENDWSDNDYIASKAYSPNFQLRATVSADSSCKGVYTSDCVNSLVKVGSVQKADYLGAEKEGPCPNTLPEEYVSLAADHKIDDLARLWPPGSRDFRQKIKKVKHAIAGNNPVIISMICPNSFLNASGVWNPEEEPDKEDGRHALCVIGYDDNQYEGAFEVQNSWGTNWGNDGRMWIKYDDFARFTYQAFEIIKLTKSKLNLKSKEKQIEFEGTMRLIDINTNDIVPVKVAEKTRNFTTKHRKGKYTYKSTKPYTSGTEIRMFIESNTPAFVYVLGTGSVNTQVGTLFPYEGVSAALNREENEIALPGEYSSFHMDETVGTDYLIVLFSKSVIDIKALESELSEGTGHISDKLKETLGNRLIESQHIQYESERISFKVRKNSTSRGIMVMVLAFDHIK